MKKGFISYNREIYRIEAKYKRDKTRLQYRCPHPICTGWINQGDGRDKNKNVVFCLICGKIVRKWNWKYPVTPDIMKWLFS